MSIQHQPPGGTFFSFRLRASVFFFLLTALVLIGAYIYSEWRAYREETSSVPRLSFDSFHQRLVEYRRRFGSYPPSVYEMERALRSSSNSNNVSEILEQLRAKLGPDGSRWTKENYHYIYSFVSPHVATLWAIPIGKRRGEAPTHFFVIRPDRLDRWRGGALALEDVAKLGPTPTLEQLGVLGMVLQAPLMVEANGKFRLARASELGAYARLYMGDVGEVRSTKSPSPSPSPSPSLRR